MTVKELIEKLKKFDDDMPVCVENIEDNEFCYPEVLNVSDNDDFVILEVEQ